jgi:nitroreductase
MHRLRRTHHLMSAKKRIKHMHKAAVTDHPVHELIRNRWSPRSFSDKPVEPAVLASLFEAARWAASSYNDQPWAYLVATKDDPENFRKMLEVLVEFNAKWAKNAPVLAISIARRNFGHNGTPNPVAVHDVGAANAQLTAEATSRGLLVHQMAGFSHDKARQTFGIPDGWDPVSAIAIGYPGDPQTLPEDFRKSEVAPRTRKPIREFVMSGSWGHTAPFAAK